ncbi:GMC family oxidoreductase N-terminal domain-containing protein [Gammaproteobacteria bacterium]|nr:GMC family oxidoreductase N-terminal domain-containing protein [Gammaproteobacteria bacterium]
MKYSHKYIIIGAGSAGCVLANKLSENPDNSVLVIEAGPMDNLSSIKMPLAASSLFKNKKYGWGYETEPEKNLNNRSINWPRGKTLGGSSSINGMLYIRGQAEDYETWENAGNIGWGYRDLMKYFIALENNQNHEDQYHGNFGSLWVETYEPILEASKYFLNACKENGFTHNHDFNGEDQEGYGQYQVNIKDGQRFSAADAFLKPVLHRSNLDLLTDTLVEKVLVSNKKAIGVKAKVKNKTQIIGCTSEIILCGGSINSPQILMLSGIGPKNHLKDNNIALVHDLPGVGQNLQDHLTVNISYKINTLKTFSELMKPLGMVKNLFEYFIQKKGLMTYPASDIGVFLKTNRNISRPDAQIHFAPGAGKYHKNGSMKPSSGITASVCNLRPKSRGHLELISNRVEDPPKIFANYLSATKDLKVMIDGIKRTREIFRTDVMKGLSAKEILPGEECISDKDLEKFIKNEALSVYHPVGTCKMGTGPECVVDTNLMVKGLQGLRVADASIFPEIISGNTNATCNVIGAKCADLILERG